MYHALLTNRYLTSRIIPFIAVAAVALCVALVIIVVSVMTGFLNMVKDSGRTLMGDVVVSYPVSGIPHYDRFIEMIEQLDEAEAATPVVESYCLLRMPYPLDSVNEKRDKKVDMVQFWGIEPESFARVTGFGDTLHWRDLDDDQWQLLFGDVILNHWQTISGWFDEQQRFDFVRHVANLERSGTGDTISDANIRRMLDEQGEINWELAFRRVRYRPELFEDLLTPQQWLDLVALDPRLLQPDQILTDGLTLARGPGPVPAIVMGMHVSEANTRNRDGSYDTYGGSLWMPRYEVTLTTMPVGSGASEPESMVFPIANEFQSGVFLIDDMRVMIPLAQAQKLMHLDEWVETDPDDFEIVLGTVPPRATMILVRAAEGITPEVLRDLVRGVYDDFSLELESDDSAYTKPPMMMMSNIMTWTEQQKNFIGPVEKERELMRTLFSLVYLVCAGLVLSIFWAIVYEKTRDIGILRSVGASRLGISWIFLRYGLIVGTLGAIFGLGLGWVVVHNINAIHTAMGEPPVWLAWLLGATAFLSIVITIIKSFSGRLLPPVLGALVSGILILMTTVVIIFIRIGGVLIWDPSVYYFSVIPNEVDMINAYQTMIGAVLFSIVGSFLPAAKAADVDPVKALHYE